jgi:hypothetical protein
MTNLAGHDLDSVLAAFHAVEDDRPTCFIAIAYTIKGYRLPFPGDKDNNAGLMNLDQITTFRHSMKVAQSAEWESFIGLDLPTERLAEFLEGLLLARLWRASARRRSQPPDFAPVHRGQLCRADFDVPVHHQRRQRVELAEALLREGGKIQPPLRVLFALGQRRKVPHRPPSPEPSPRERGEGGTREAGG